jgi:nicotinamidase-related amidase
VRIDRSHLAVLVVDAQPFFLDLAYPDPGDPAREALLVRLEHLLMLAGWAGLPLLATFEKPVEENGWLPDRLERVFPASGRRFVKNFFGSTSEPEIRSALGDLGMQQVAVAGAETDVCILQTTLGLLEMGLEVVLLEDCLFTTEPRPEAALRRMERAGAVPATLKSVAYELVECVDGTPWYPETALPGTSPLPAGFIPPEQWPPRQR